MKERYNHPHFLSLSRDSRQSETNIFKERNAENNKVYYVKLLYKIRSGIERNICGMLRRRIHLLRTPVHSAIIIKETKKSDVRLRRLTIFTIYSSNLHPEDYYLFFQSQKY